MTTKNKKTSKRTLKGHLKHLLVPHKANQYHPHLIRRRGIITLMAIVIVGQLGYNVLTHGSGVLGRTTTTTISGLLAQTNSARQKESLPPLKLNSSLDQAAYEKAQDMLQHNYWAHVSPTGVQPWSWITSVGYNYNTAGENLAKNYDSSQSTVAAWLASPTHRANIMNTTYTDVGFSVVEGQLLGQDTSLVVAYYAEPASSAVLGSAAPGSFNEAKVTSSNPLSYIGSIVQSFNSATIGSLVLLTLAICVALVTYAYRSKLPKALRHSWKAHHAAYKAIGFAAVAVIVVSLGVASTGQI